MFNFLILVPVFIGILFYANRRDERNAENQYKELVEKGRKWQEEQDKLLKFSVMVTTKSGNVYTSGSFSPRHEVDYLYNTYILNKHTSYDLAIDFINKSIEKDRYMHCSTFIPMCEIESLKAKIENG